MSPGALAAQGAPPPRRLEAIRVTDASACGADADAGDIGTVWTSARASLRATQPAEDSLAPLVRSVRFVRQEDLNGRERLVEIDTTFVRSAEPFRTLAPDVLSRQGYLITSDSAALMFAPDARVLLSEEFAADHCFRLVGDPAYPELIGLRFTPAPGRRVVDVAGTFWLDRESSELERVAYDYRNLSDEVAEARSGGSLEFGRLGDGVRGITRWEVRTPVIGPVRVVMRSGSSKYELQATGTNIEGAEIVPVATTDSLSAATRGFLVGRITDSTTRGGGLAGARVTIVGTGRATRTDSSGSFALDGVPAGVYTVRVDHERLRLYRVPNRRDMAIPARAPAVLQFGVPSATEAFGTVCGVTGSSGSRAGAVGRVVERTSGLGVTGAVVQVTWRGRWFPRRVQAGAERARADDVGHFALCALEANAPLRITVRAPGYQRVSRRLRARAGQLGDVTIEMRPCAAGDSGSDCARRE